MTVASYKVRRDGTSIDNFVCDLLDFLGSRPSRVEVSGLFGETKKPDHRAFRHLPMSRAASGWNKRYWVRLVVNPEEWGLAEVVAQAKALDWGSKEARDGYYSTLEEKVCARLERFIARHSRIGVAVTVGNGTYVTLAVELPVTSYDLIIHCNSSLSDVAVGYSREVSRIADRLLTQRGVDLHQLYSDRVLRNKILRLAEDEFRECNNLPKIGESNLTETVLYHEVRKYFPDAMREHSPQWLKPQRFDIYIPTRLIAIEYHGRQHYEPIELFGGETALAKRKRLDRKKRGLAEKFGVTLVEWPHSKKITPEAVLILLKQLNAL